LTSASEAVESSGEKKKRKGLEGIVVGADLAVLCLQTSTQLWAETGKESTLSKSEALESASRETTALCRREKKTNTNSGKRFSGLSK